MIFELAAFDFQTALNAINSNVKRIELCQDYTSGGITPDINLIESVMKYVNVDVFIMIRCRPGNFIYSNTELAMMHNFIDVCKELNVSGFVFGALNSKNQVDESACKKIIDKAHPLPVTFHRAFDNCNDIYKSTENIIEYGFTRILTSGTKENAYMGRYIIKDLVERYGSEIIFVPGGGIRNNNYEEIVNLTKVTEIHSSKIIF